MSEHYPYHDLMTNAMYKSMREPIDTNQKGGKQSAGVPHYTLLPPLALEAIALVLHHGADRYGKWNWLLIPTEDHIDHCLGHLLGYMSNDQTADNQALYSNRVNHLAQAATRALFALDCAIRDDIDKQQELEEEELYKRVEESVPDLDRFGRLHKPFDRRYYNGDF